MLTLSQRSCWLGEKYSGAKVKEEDARSLKVELRDIILSDVELNIILGEPHAHQVLFNYGREPIEPYLLSVKEFELKEPWENAHVDLIYQYGTSKLAMPKATVSKIKLRLLRGGETAMSCTVEAVPDLDNKFGDIIDRTGSGIELAMRAQLPHEQLDMPLNTYGTGEQRESEAR